MVEEGRSHKLADDEASVPVPAGAVNVEASEEVVASALVAADVVSCAGVEVDETNGGAC